MSAFFWLFDLYHWVLGEALKFSLAQTEECHTVSDSFLALLELRSESKVLRLLCMKTSWEKLLIPTIFTRLHFRINFVLVWGCQRSRGPFLLLLWHLLFLCVILGIFLSIELALDGFSLILIELVAVSIHTLSIPSIWIRFNFGK